MLDFQQIQLFELNVGVLLQNIDWYDPWIILLVIFHLSILATTFMTRNSSNIQLILFLFLILLVYCSEKINKLASENWKFFSKRQYFDSNGLFISIVFCVPILLNCMLMIANWLYMSRELMVQLKIAQLRSQRLQARNSLVNSEMDINSPKLVSTSHAKQD